MVDTFIMPEKILCGEEALYEAANILTRMGKRALIVTDPVMERLGKRKTVTDLLEKVKIGYTVFSDITGEPDDGMIELGAVVYKEKQCDFLVALGGGSAIDAMKAIAILVRYEGNLGDYAGRTVEETWIPMVAIPTTAGTGSEATQFAIITNRKTKVKMVLKGSALMPDLAVIDPRFAVTTPPTVTAATGIDALTHAIEAYTSRKAQPLSDIFALSASRRIFSNLRHTWACGEDLNGRKEMALAALEAGIAFNNSSVTVIHGMSRPIGALFHVPHGISNAMLLKVCLEYIADGAQERLAKLSEVCGISEKGEIPEVASRKFLLAVEMLLKEIQIPTLKEYGIDGDAFLESIPKMAMDAEASQSPANTRKLITVEIIEELYRKLWKQSFLK